MGAVLDELRAAALPYRWVESNSLHITLKFLGQVADERCSDIASALARAVSGIASFEIEIGGFGAFPSRTRPHIIWVRVHAPPALFELQERVEQEFVPLGFAREKRAFQPHLTIGRARSGAGATVDLDRITSSLVYKAKIGVESVDLMRSHPSPRGARYERIERHGLSH